MDLFIFIITLLLSLQGLFTLFLMLYSWNDPDKAKEYASPEIFEKPQKSFTLLVPARHEELVIKETIETLTKINYPKNLFEVFILTHEDDKKTISAVNQALSKPSASMVKLVTFGGNVQNKPHALNVGRAKSNHDVIGIFDAEDEPHTDILNIVNTIMVTEGVRVLQSGVQLMNHRSHWYSLLNVLEYFFWFKSFLQFFARSGFTPLGGNTVFFSKETINAIGGWQEHFLTEDADIGIRLSIAGYKIRVIYDEEHVTREETPMSLLGFIRQRTRWNQGFLQIFAQGNWLKVPGLFRKVLLGYILFWPVIQIFTVLYIPFSIIFSITQKVPIALALFTNIPMYLLFLQCIAMSVGIWEFTRKFKQRFSILSPFIIVITFFPYQIVLGISAMRALIRFFMHSQTWEKTQHINAHRN